MKNVFIDRDEEGNIIACYFRPQKNGHESKPEEDQEIIEYRNRPEPELTNEEIYEKSMKNDKLIKAIILSLNQAGAFSSDGVVLKNSELKKIIKANL